MAVAGIFGGQALNLVVDKALKNRDHRASQDADLNALSAKLEQGETFLKAFFDNHPDPKLTRLGSPLRNALTHGAALREEAHTAHENYNAGVQELGAAVGAFTWFTGNYAPRLKTCKENVEKELQSLTVCAQAQAPFGGYGGFKVGQKVDARRGSQCWSAVSISEIKDGMATVVGNDCGGARFKKKLPLDSNYLKLGDWSTPPALFLPLMLQGVRVLVADDEEPNVWLVTNDGLESTESGIGYRSNPLDDDTIPQGWCANWNDLLVGVDQGDGWVRCWPKVSQIVELKNQDDHDAVFIHLNNNSQRETSCHLPNGTQIEVIGQYDGDSFMVEYNGKGYGVKKRHCKRPPALQQAENSSSLPGTQAS